MTRLVEHGVALLWTTFADATEAERIAEAVVGERLAACANILPPCTSIYRWQDRVERGSEVAVIFKTRPMLAPRLHDRIAALHSYDLPVIETWPASASPAAVDWVAVATGA